MTVTQERQQIYFAHANGFPGLCYQQLFNAWSSRYQVNYCEMLGHDPKYPITDNWDHLVTELIVDIKQKAQAPVIAIGHSLGGALLYLATGREPELFQAVIMLDSPVLNKMKRRVVKLAKQFNFIDWLTPAKKSKHRRQHWGSIDEAYHYLRHKPLFQHFQEACFQDYLTHGFIDEGEKGVTLKFRRDMEYRIFRNLPHVSVRLPKEQAVPLGFIYGKASEVVKQSDLRYLSKYKQVVIQVTAGGHMFPFEDPAGCIQACDEMIEKLLPYVTIIKL